MRLTRSPISIARRHFFIWNAALPLIQSCTRSSGVITQHARAISVTLHVLARCTLYTASPRSTRILSSAPKTCTTPHRIQAHHLLSPLDLQIAHALLRRISFPPQSRFGECCILMSYWLLGSLDSQSVELGFPFDEAARRTEEELDDLSPLRGSLV